MRAAVAVRVAAVAVIGAAACEPVDRVQERFRADTPHEAYAASLAQAGLAETALARDWIDAADRALLEQTTVDSPYRESGYLPPQRPSALAYRLELERGQEIVADLQLEPVDADGRPVTVVERTQPTIAADDDSAGVGETSPLPRTSHPPRVFLDLYRVGGDSTDVLYHEVSADSGALRLEHEPWRGGTFVLRVQPELLRGGRYTLEVFSDASLAFPVDGANTRNIQSVFGDPREGGRREHHGVDIFAARGTPVIAASAGRVRGVRTTPIGGRVVWLRDGDRSQSLYYAHLDSQLVSDGMRVEPGDTVGLVGNSGNARTTPPHLHFGIYRRGQGPVDPYPFLFRPDTMPDPVRTDPSLAGRWARAATDDARMRAAPDLRASVIDELPDRTALRVVAASGDWYRVELPDGRQGYLYGNLTEPADGPVDERLVAAAAGIRSQPLPHAPVVDSIAGGSPVPVLGYFGEFLLVRGPDGLTGWLADVAGAADAIAGETTSDGAGAADDAADPASDR